MSCLHGVVEGWHISQGKLLLVINSLRNVMRHKKKISQKTKEYILNTMKGCVYITHLLCETLNQERKIVIDFHFSRRDEVFYIQWF